MTTALSVLEQRLSEQVGDYLEVIVTTAIAANTSIVSTNLTSYDGGRDDYFNDWWVYITDKANAAVQRQVSDYATATGTLTIRGANLTTDVANLATIRLHRYNRDLYVNAINDAIRETFPTLHKRFDIAELVAGNILPNSHFRDWTSASYPDKWSVTNATVAASTTAGTYRGGAKSAKVTASAAGGYMYIHSDSYPKLLDLMGQSVSLYAWALPEVADDAMLEIYTKQADGTEQTLDSTTESPAGEFTRLELEDQALNDDLVEASIRLVVATNAKYVYFDDAKLFGVNEKEYLLPLDIKSGKLASVQVQTGGLANITADDLSPRNWQEAYDWEILDDGTDKFLRFNPFPQQERRIRLKGYAPLSAVSAYTSTIEIEGELVNRFIAYAKYKLYQAIEGPVATADIGRYETQSAKAYNEYMRLSHLRMMPPKTQMKIREYIR